MRVRIGALALSLTVLSTLTACESDACSSATCRPPAHLDIGFKTNLDGVSTLIEGQNVFEGSDPNIAAALAERMSFTYSSVPITQSNWRDALNLKDPPNHNHVDMVIAAISYATDRSDVQMAYSYMKTDLGALAPEGGPSISKEEDLKNKVVCVGKDSTAEAEMRSIGIDPIAEDEPRCLKRLQAPATAQFYVSDRVILEAIAANKTEGSFSVSDAPIGKYQYYVVAMPGDGDVEFCKRVVATLREYVGSPDWVEDIKSGLSLSLSTDEIQKKFSTNSDITDKYCTLTQSNG